MARVKWNVDPYNSSVSFKVRHLMISTITGFFRKFHLSVTTEGEDFRTADNIHFTADVDSIDTNNPQREKRLISEDFFEEDMHRIIKFNGDKFELEGNNAKLFGYLTIRNVTKPVHLNVEFGGIQTDPNNKRKAGFIVTGELNRHEYNLHWNGVTVAGQVVVGDKIKILCEIQLEKEE